MFIIGWFMSSRAILKAHFARLRRERASVVAATTTESSTDGCSQYSN